MIDRRALLPGLVAGVLAALAAAGLAAAAEPTAAPPPAATVPGRVIVQWAPGARRGGKEAAREGAEVTYQANLGDPSFQLVEVEPGQSVTAAAAELEGAPAVEVAEPDTYAEPTALPNDPLFGDQWALRNLGTGIDGFSGAVAGDDIGALGAWAKTVGSPSTVVADIDSGYRFDSPDLGPVAWENPGETAGNGIDDYVDDVHGWDFVGEDAEAPSEDADPTDSDLISGGHGVHTAGIIGAAGDNGVGITGVAQDVRIMPLRVCANAPSLNELRCPTSSLIAAINYAGHNGAKVANMSLTSSSKSVAELDAIAANPDTLYVAAAGNEAQDNDSHAHYPCNFEPGTTAIPGAVENVVCVAATDPADGLASFSDWGAETVDLGAPGTQILSTYPAFEEIADDDFEAEDFGTRWKTPTGIGAEGGFERTDEAPLTSFGISDSPGRTPVANSIRASQLSSPVPVSAEDGSCSLSGLDSVSLGGGTFKVTIFENGLSAFTFSVPSTTGSGMRSFSTVPMTGLDGANVGLRLTYTAGAAPTAGAGAWVDDLQLSCYAPLSTPPTYAYLEGTSMAAPQVSGAAALLFSEKPSASVEEISDALLSSVDPVASLAGKTVSGGRLDAARALDWLEPPAPVLSSDPASPAADREPEITGTVAAGNSVVLYESASCTGFSIGREEAAEFESRGFPVLVPAGTTAAFSAVVKTRYNTSPCSATLTYANTSPFVRGTVTVMGEPTPPSPTPVTPAPTVTATSCTVPKLAGKTLARATAALKRAGCAVGKAKKNGRKGAKAGTEVVVSSRPAAGTKTSAAVSLRLAPKAAGRHRRY